MDQTNNHWYVCGYWTGRYTALKRAQELLTALRITCQEDNAAQLSLDRQQTILDREFSIVEDKLFEIPRSN